MFKSYDNQLWWKDRLLGPADQVYCYWQEEVPGAVVYKGSRVDFVLVIPGDRPLVMGVESKWPKDFYQSWRSRRLARQLKQMGDVVDVPAVMVRGADWSVVIKEGRGWRDIGYRDFKKPLRDLVALQGLGGIFLPGPEDDADVVEWLREYAKGLTDLGKRTALAGRDVPPGGRDMRPGWWLRRLPGWGQAATEKAIQAFGSVDGVLAARGEDLKAAGLRANQIAILKEARK